MHRNPWAIATDLTILAMTPNLKTPKKRQAIKRNDPLKAEAFFWEIVPNKNGGGAIIRPAWTPVSL